MISPRSSVAYQQVLYGSVAYEFTTDDMLYSMANERTWKQYGFSPVEQALLTISLGLRRLDSQIQWYTSGNTPEAMIFLPPSMDIDQVKEIQDWFDTVNAGDMAQRRRIRFMPEAAKGRRLGRTSSSRKKQCSKTSLTCGSRNVSATTSA